MKKIILIISALLYFQFSFAFLPAKVDKRFELTSIMFALAGVPEYCQCAIPSYLQDIKTYFEPYEQTVPINYIRKLHQLHNIGYDAVSTIASMLEITNGEIQLQRQYAIHDIEEYDSRWTSDLLTDYIFMLNQFYTESDFQNFWETHTELYNMYEKQMNVVLQSISDEWIKTFYGKQDASKLQTYICLNNGPHNYAVRDGILIGVLPNRNGNVEQLFTILHEVGHHYSNSLLKPYWPQMEDAANRMYPYIKDMMIKSSYANAQISLLEGINNLFTLMYFKEHDESNVMFRWHLKNYTEKGFIWLPYAVKFMANFYADRQRYPCIRDFIPQLVAFINDMSSRYNIIIREFESRHPYIVNTYPSIGSDISDFNEIIISFSEPMNTDTYAFAGNGTENGDENVLQLPIELENIKWLDDGQKLVLPLDKSKIEIDKLYGIQLYPRGFTSLDFYWLDNKSKNITYNTQKQ